MEPSPARAHAPGTVRVGSVAGIEVQVQASWFLFAIVLAVLVAPRIEEAEPGIGVWKYAVGLAYAVLLYFTILLHETSHAVAARRFGLPVHSISLNFLGGATQIEAEPRTAAQEFVVAVVGPLTSVIVGGVFLVLAGQLPDGLVRLTVQGVAVANLVLGVLNLIPGLPLDGGRVLRAVIWALTANPHRGTIVAAWAGRLMAVACLALPAIVLPQLGVHPQVSDFILAAMVAAFMWFGATASLNNARIRQRLPSLRARALARRAIAVPDDLPVSEAVRRANEAGAGAIVVHASNDKVTGIVHEAALLAVPDERKPWVPVSSVARSFEPGLALPADIAGEPLVRAMGATPADEYVLIDDDGGIYGVLVSDDVDRAFQEGARR